MKTSSNLAFIDYIGNFKVRWGISRGNYQVNPGIYALGTPSEESPVLVTANYKLSFDILRKSLKGYPVWILVLDTKGINVWCAAGKGTFGTEELIHQIESADLKNIVVHSKVILPQLGAVGIAAHEVKKITGFQVIYGPVKADDIPEFFENNFKATKEMREVQFTLWDRLVLTPIELVHSVIPVLILALIFSAIYGFSNFVTVLCYFSIAVFAGAVITPALLPFIPGRSFSLKGAIVGVILTLVSFMLVTPSTVMLFISWLIIMTVISSFLAMNFTGSSTYTSWSGVKKEMSRAVPMQFWVLLIGVILFIINRFIGV
jgi:hypothetical protein